MSEPNEVRAEIGGVMRCCFEGLPTKDGKYLPGADGEYRPCPHGCGDQRTSRSGFIYAAASKVWRVAWVVDRERALSAAAPKQEEERG